MAIWSNDRGRKNRVNVPDPPPTKFVNNQGLIERPWWETEGDSKPEEDEAILPPPKPELPPKVLKPWKAYWERTTNDRYFSVGNKYRLTFISGSWVLYGVEVATGKYSALVAELKVDTTSTLDISCADDTDPAILPYNPACCSPEQEIHNQAYLMAFSLLKTIYVYKKGP